jgi:hypothetical protein
VLSSILAKSSCGFDMSRNCLERIRGTYELAI